MPAYRWRFYGTSCFFLFFFHSPLNFIHWSNFERLKWLKRLFKWHSFQFGASISINFSSCWYLVFGISVPLVTAHCRPFQLSHAIKMTSNNNLLLRLIISQRYTHRKSICELCFDCGKKHTTNCDMNIKF